VANTRTESSEIERMRAENLALRVALDAERERASSLEAERDRVRKAYDALKAELELMRRGILAAKAERVDTAQLELEFAKKLQAVDELAKALNKEPAAPPTTKPKPKPTGRRDLSQMGLPEDRIEFKDDVMESLVSEGKAKRIGFEESSKIGYRRGGNVRIVIARAKYLVLGSEAADGGPGEPQESSQPESAATTPRALIVTAAMPAELLPRSIVAPSKLAHIICENLRFAQPLFRQELKSESEGVPIRRGAMSRWKEDAGNTVGATIVAAARKHALATASCIATDATGVLVQPIQTHEKRQACRRAHMFVQIADRDHVFFEFLPAETSKTVYELFRGFSGYVLADAKSVYDLLYREPRRDDDVVPDGCARREAGCWAHLRRKFYEAAAISKDPVAREGLYRIHRVFEYEEKFRSLSPAQRATERARLSQPHVDAFFAWVCIELDKVRDQRGLLRTALAYADNHEPAFRRFLEDGRLPVDNNGSERELRRVAIGRKNWLFVGSDDHGQATASLLSLIASALLHQLDPETYLRDIFRVLPHWPADRYVELAPLRWTHTRARLDPVELALEIGPLAIPTPPEQQAPTR
jgi:hypothetical protein